MPIFVGTSAKNQEEIIINGLNMEKVWFEDTLVWQKVSNDPLIMIIVDSNDIALSSYNAYFSQPTFVYQIFHITAMRIVGITIRWTDAPPADYNVRLKIYNLVGNRPNELIATSSNVVHCSMGNTPDARFIFNTTLPEGDYCYETSYEDIVTMNDDYQVLFDANENDLYIPGTCFIKIGSTFYDMDGVDVFSSIIYYP